MKRNTMATPKIKIHNHNHKYDTRSKRHCCLCSSTQGSPGEKEHDIQNTCSKRLVGRKSVVKNKRVVACAQSSELPEELIYTILLLVPAKFLYENMRFVSRVWRQTITSPCFITNHLQISSAHHTHDLLVDFPCHQNNVALYIKPPTSGDANPEYQVTELAKPPFECRIRGSYHGLVLLQHTPNRDQFHVVNLVTKSIVSLPCFPLENSEALTWAHIAFSYASSINRYKVVIGIQLHGKQLLQYFPLQVWVCTVGIDQYWRKLELQGLDEICGTFSSRINYPTCRSVGGIVYWSCCRFPHGCALDVDTERFYRFTTSTTPNTIPHIRRPQYWIICLQTGLGLVISYEPESGSRYVLWELYELTDLKSSKWTKIIDIDVRLIRSQVENYFQSTSYWSFRPLVYTNDEKLWFFSRFRPIDLFYYNLRDEKVVPVPVPVPIPVIEKDISAYHHVNTLLALTNCNQCN